MHDQTDSARRLRPELEVLLRLARLDFAPDDADGIMALLRRTRGSFSWEFFLDRAARHRVLPLISRNIVNSRMHLALVNGPLMPYSWVYPAAYVGNGERNQALGREFRKVLDAASCGGLEYVVRKGPVLGEHLYHDPAARVTNDLDILTTREGARHLSKILTTCGFRQGKLSEDGRSITPFARSTRVYWRLNVNNELPFVKLIEGMAVQAVMVDICLSILPRQFENQLPVSDLLGERQEAPLCGTNSWCLSWTHQFLDLCLHLHKEATSLMYVKEGIDLQLGKFVDIAAMAGEIERRGLWDRVVLETMNRRLQKFVYFAIFHTGVLFTDAIPRHVLEALRPDETAYLDEFGELDGQLMSWEMGLLERLFSIERDVDLSQARIIPED